jgi:hypothetical protein
MSFLLATCPRHHHYDPGCAYCEAASDISNQSLHPGGCDYRCKSTEHYKTDTPPDRGVAGKSGILYYYANGTTSADPRMPI